MDMKLYFLRHGLAGERSEWKGGDSERPLTEAGMQRMERESVTIAKLNLNITWILSSPLVRSYQTAEIVAKRIKMLDRLVKDERLRPGFDVNHLKEILKEYSRDNPLMFVGHEPDMSEMVSQLIGGGKIVSKKGSVACVKLSESDSLKGELLWLIPAKMLAL